MAEKHGNLSINSENIFPIRNGCILTMIFLFENWYPMVAMPLQN